ncbi:hypothetical protein ACF0H5_024469 [Mactra antiquata]
MVINVDSSSNNLELLETTSFDSFVTRNDLVLIFFKSSHECPSCNKAMEYFHRIPQPELIDKEIKKRYVIDEEISLRLGITEYPAIVYFRQGYPALYNGKLSSVDEIPEFIEWLVPASQVATQDLFDNSFEHLTQAASGATTGDWFVFFYNSECTKCFEVFPSLESVAISLKHKMNFAKVDGEMNKNLVKRFKIKEFPYAILFKQGKMYGYEPGKYDVNSMTAFIQTWYKNVKSSPVPREPTAFDILTETIAAYIKEQVESRNWLFFLGVGCGIVFLIVIIIISLKRPDDRHKTD